MNDFLERAFEPHLPPLTDLMGYEGEVVYDGSG